MKTFAFIDASNLFYGGEKSLGWKIDYSKLIKYLRKKYQASEVYYFGGVELHGFEFDYLKNDSVSVERLKNYLTKLVRLEGKKSSDAQLLLLDRHLQRVKFYLKLKKFGFRLFLKPVKMYVEKDGSTQRKANCDVEMAFYLMKEEKNLRRLVFLSGDGDFLPVLKYMRSIGKEVVVLARGERTAREIRQFAGNKFSDFVKLKRELKYEDK